jgi:hypothetical protein
MPAQCECHSEERDEESAFSGSFDISEKEKSDPSAEFILSITKDLRMTPSRVTGATIIAPAR